MINPKHIAAIVREVLRRMDVPQPAIAKLIRGTFAVESGLSILYSHRLYGLALMSEAEVKTIHGELLKYNRALREKILYATNINTDTLSYDDFKFTLSSNIAFMVAVLYIYYSTTYSEPPEDNMNDIARHYMKYYAKEDDVKYMESFKAEYSKVFS